MAVRERGPDPADAHDPAGADDPVRSRGLDLRLVPVALATEVGSLTGIVMSAPARLPVFVIGCLAAAAVLLARFIARRLDVEPTSRSPRSEGARPDGARPGAFRHRARRRCRWRRSRWRPGGFRPAVLLARVGSLSVLGVLLVGLAATATGVVAQSRRDEDPVARLAVAGRSARVEATVDAVPRPVTGSAAPGSVLVRVRVTSLRSGGEPTAAHASVTVLADRTWSRLEPGSRVSATLRFRVRRGISADAAFAIVRGPPTLLAGPGRLRNGTGRIRAGLARVSAPLGQPAAGLLPAVVHGDTSRVPAELSEQFRISGLAHLQAVSGANVAIVVLAATAVTVALGGGRVVSAVVGISAVAGFAVLADLSPPVVRAGGTAVLVLLGARGAPARGPALLSTALTLLLLADPWLAADVGFALSVSATAGILAAGSRFGAALATWLPRPVATAAGIGLAAQTACQPLLTAISGQVGLVAPFTNLAAEPAVAVATLAGVLAALLACVPGVGLLGVVADRAAVASAQVGGLACRWLAAVARTGASTPGATADWAGTVLGVTAAVGVTVLALIAGPSLLGRRRIAVAAAGALAGVVAGPVVLR